LNLAQKLRKGLSAEWGNGREGSAANTSEEATCIKHSNVLYVNGDVEAIIKLVV
jgi:hypothetical protein